MYVLCVLCVKSGYLCEVPLDLAKAKDARSLVLQKHPHRVRIVAIHLALLHEQQITTIGHAKPRANHLLERFAIQWFLSDTNKNN